MILSYQDISQCQLHDLMLVVHSLLRGGVPAHVLKTASTAMNTQLAELGWAEEGGLAKKKQAGATVEALTGQVRWSHRWYLCA